MSLNTISGKFDINGYPIHYDKFGTGDDVILLISGSLGSPRYDFKAQLEGPYSFDLSKYTIVGVDLPGWGRSRPPRRAYGSNVNLIDIECCIEVMDNLGYQQFSVIGWSEGAKIGLALCYLHPERVKCAVLIAIFLWMSKKSLAPILQTRNTKLWPKEQMDAFLQIYGDKDTVQELWDQHLDVIQEVFDQCDHGHHLVSKEQLAEIKTPVLLIHGDKDSMIGVEHSIYCKDNIKGSVLHRFPRGSHNCHQVFANEFKNSFENFINSSNEPKF